MTRSKQIKLSVISGNLGSTIEQNINIKETLDMFEVNQSIFLDKIYRNASGLTSVVSFTLKVLRHCLRYINYRQLSKTFDFKNKTKEKELFRYLHLIVDLSSNSNNHPLVMHPYFIRNVLIFILNSKSENLIHYHRIFDCKLALSDLINMTRKSYFLEYFSIDQIIRCLEHLRYAKHELFVRFCPIIYLHCV